MGRYTIWPHLQQGEDRMRGSLHSSLFINWGCQYPTKYSHFQLWVTGLRLLHLQISHNVLVANSHKFSHCLLQLPYNFCPRTKVQVLRQIMLLCTMLETENKLLSGGLAVVSHPGRQVFPEGRCFYSNSGGPEVQYTPALGMPSTRPLEHRMMP